MSLNEKDKVSVGGNPLLTELERIRLGYGVDEAAKRDEAALDILHSGKRVAYVPLDSIGVEEVATPRIREALTEQRTIAELVAQGGRTLENPGVPTDSRAR